MSIGRACVVCGKISEQSRCPEHRVPAWHNPRRRRATGSGWAQQARAKRILARDGGICHRCKKPGATEADHVVPIAEGGADTEDNMAAIHTHCHREKTAEESRRGRYR